MGYKSVVEHLSSMHKGLDSILSGRTRGRERRREENSGREEGREKEDGGIVMQMFRACSEGHLTTSALKPQ